MGSLEQGKRDAETKGTQSQRRSHTKSRAGCLSCKTRKIRCSGEKPKCSNCIRKSRTCEWPAPKLNPAHLRFGDSQYVPLAGPPSHPLSLVNDEFTLRDLRLFHHFLAHASPSLPLGNQHIWIHEIPQLVHEHDHLMHALLALGASHIASRTPSSTDINEENYRSLAHRGHAIAGLKKAFSKTKISSSESDAMLATCYALAFQSAHVSDGCLDFATFVRGCGMITRRIQHGAQRTIFNLSSEPMQSPTKVSPSCDDSPLNFQLPSQVTHLLTHGIQALEDAKGCMVHHRVDINFYRTIHATFTALQHSPALGYIKFLSFYTVWFKVAEDSMDVHLISGLVRDSAQLLWAYFIGLQLLMLVIVRQAAMEKGVSLLEEERGLRSSRLAHLTVTVAWLEAIAQSTPRHLQHCLAWPRKMAEAVTGLFGVPRPAEKDVQRRLDILQDLGLRAHTVLVSVLDISATLTNWTEDGLARVNRLERFPGFRINAGSNGHGGNLVAAYRPPSFSDEVYSQTNGDLDILYSSDMLHLHSKLMV